MPLEYGIYSVSIGGINSVLQRRVRLHYFFTIDAVLCFRVESGRLTFAGAAVFPNFATNAVGITPPLKLRGVYRRPAKASTPPYLNLMALPLAPRTRGGE